MASLVCAVLSITNNDVLNIYNPRPPNMTVAIGCKSFKLIILLNIFVVLVPSSRLPH